MTELQYVREVMTLLPRRIVDGDTWWCYVNLGYRQLGYFEYRLLGWDTPEVNTAEDVWERGQGNAATLAAGTWWSDQIRAGGRRILIRSEPDPEKYGRWLGDLWAETPAGEQFHLGAHLSDLQLATSSDGTRGTRWRDTYGTGR